MVVICGWHGLPRPGEGEITVGSVLQFSKERHIMDRTPERLKKELEEELLLSSEDLRSHAWYHGRIPRQVRSAPLRDSLTLMPLLNPAQRPQNAHAMKCLTLESSLKRPLEELKVGLQIYFQP